MSRLDGIEYKKVGKLAFYSEEDREASEIYWRKYEVACKFLGDLGIEIE